VARVGLVLAGNVYVHHWDTPAYLEAAREPLWSLVFHPTRAPGYPLVLKLAGESERAVIVGQAGVASFAWLFLAYSLARWFRDRPLRWIAFLAFAALSFAIPVWQWDYILYAESLSLALFALVAGLVVRYARERRSTDLVGLALLSVPFCLLRDTNLLACVAAGLFVAALRPAPPAARVTRAAALAVILVGAPLLAGALAAGGTRGALSTANVILLRVATDPPLRDRMLSRYGMPRSALACTGVLAWDCADGLAEFRAWTAGPGRGAYLHLLLTHPGFAARSVWDAWPAAVGGAGIERYGDPRAIRSAHAEQPKVHALPLIADAGSHVASGRSISVAVARLTFAGLVARLGPRSGRLLSLVPLVVLAVLIAASPAIRAAPGTVLPAAFFAAVLIAQLPIALLATDSIPRLMVLASVSMSCLALSVLLALVDAFRARGRT
jgi:hypothetical protein